MAFSPESDTLSDEDLVARVRAGDREAYGVLWQRHSAAALSVARQYQGVADPDDILQEAAKTVFSSILRGGGPFGAFRPYLKQSVRNAAVSISRRKREAPIGGLEEIAEHSAHMAYDDNDNALERMITVRAFKALPARWQEVLWYTCVEGMPAREAASRLGLSANATAALAKRAREGLRRSWLEAHVSDDRLPGECRTIVQQLPAYERRSLTPTVTAQVDKHLSECLRCSIVAGGLDGIADRLPVILLPLAIAGIDVFGRGTELAQAFLASHIVSGSGSTVAASGVATGAEVVPDAAAQAAHLTGDSAAAAASTATGGAGSGAAGGGSSTGGSGAVAAGSAAGAASHAALATTKIILIGALAVGGATAVTVAAVNVIGGSPETAVVEAAESAEPSAQAEQEEGSAVSPSPSAPDLPSPEPSPLEQVPVEPSPQATPRSAPTPVPVPPIDLDATLPQRDQPTPAPAPDPTPAPPTVPAPGPTPDPPPGPGPTESLSPQPTAIIAPPSGTLYTAVKLTGKGEPGASIELWIGGSSRGTTTVLADGTWSMATPTTRDLTTEFTMSVRQELPDKALSDPVEVGTYQMAVPIPTNAYHDGPSLYVIFEELDGRRVEAVTVDGQTHPVWMFLGVGIIVVDRDPSGQTELTFYYIDPESGLTGVDTTWLFSSEPA